MYVTLIMTSRKQQHVVVTWLPMGPVASGPPGHVGSPIRLRPAGVWVSLFCFCLGGRGRTQVPCY